MAVSSDDGPPPTPGQGVGPWPGGSDAWPDGDHWDPELLEHGDARNVVDRYRYWRMDAIVADIDRRRHPLHVAIENFTHDSNIGSVVRTANAFAVAEVHIVGRRRWNRRGAMVTDRYQHLRHHDTVADFLAWAGEAGMIVIGIDNIPGSEPLEGETLPRETVMVFGQESAGLSEEMVAGCERVLHITQYGSTRSMNVGAAAAIAMWSWVVQYAGPPGEGEVSR
ncbi:MAG TPA: RNA methyltransferase [Demequina sp.]|nr:RNA methyltransferase [Demequina sp.]